MGIVRPVLEVYPYAWLFFVPFILITTFAVLNLIIGIIVNSMQMAGEEERHELAHALEQQHTAQETIEAQLSDIEKSVRELRTLMQGRSTDRGEE